MSLPRFRIRTLMVVVAVAAVASEMTAWYTKADQEEREDGVPALMLIGLLIFVFGTVAAVLIYAPGPKRP